jgi:hypothetical protein
MKLPIRLFFALLCAVRPFGIAQTSELKIPEVSRTPLPILAPAAAPDPAVVSGRAAPPPQNQPDQTTQPAWSTPTTVPGGHAFQATPFVAKGYVPAAVNQAQVIAPLNKNLSIRFTVALLPPKRAELQQRVANIMDPKSPEYRHFFTHEEWKAKYAPPDAQVAAVEAWGKTAGFKEVHRFENNQALVFDAPVATIQQAFQVTMNQYQLAGQKYYANDRKPVVPLSVAPLIDNVLGLSTFEVMHSLSGHDTHFDTALPRTLSGEFMVQQNIAHQNAVPAAKNAVRPAYSSIYGIEPADIFSAAAYNYNGLSQYSHCCNPNHTPVASPVITTIAVIGTGAVQASDVKTFFQRYTNLAANVDEVSMDSALCCSAELPLDAEWTTATSNSFGSLVDTAHVIVYQAGSTKNSELLDAWEAAHSANNARIVSSSFGSYEDNFGGIGNTSISDFRDVTTAMEGEGWSVAVASGDQGAYADCKTLSVQYPSSDPAVISVGGTTLNLPVAGFPAISETTWLGNGCSAKGGNGGGGGGGCSNTFFTVWWGNNGGCADNRRATPDISLNAASGQAVYAQGAWSPTGGTSIAAPEMAGFFAQMNSYLLYLQQQGSICGFQHNQACAPMGHPGAALYFAPNNGHTPYYDVTSGCNGGGVGTGYCAAAGFDLASGLGTPDMLQLAWAINRYNNSPGSVLPAITMSGPPINAWYSTDQTVSFTIGGATMGVAGYSAAWDVNPRILTPTGNNRGDPFWDGPQHPLATSGTLDLNQAGPGCHTAYVVAWDHNGSETEATTYGPICSGSVNQCQMTLSCPAPIHAPPNFTVACPAVSDYYTSWPDGTKSYISSGLILNGTTSSYEEGVLACVPGTTSCVGFSTYKPESQWCAPAPPPPPPPPPGSCCKACRAAGGDCVQEPNNKCLCT